jgi:AraC-like DNA-binding protein
VPFDWRHGYIRISIISPSPAVQVRRKTFAQSPCLHIGTFEVRPTTDECGEVEEQDRHVVVLPVAGLFARHDRPGHHVVGTPSHAVFVSKGKPYRLSFPGMVGDRALILRFDEDLLPSLLDVRRRKRWRASHGLLPPQALLLRNWLWKSGSSGAIDPLEAEAASLDVLASSLESMTDLDAPDSHGARGEHAVGRVKEAVSSAPAEVWDVAALARIAHMSPFHFCRVFKAVTGISVGCYVLRERLSVSLHPILDGVDLTTVALDCGFASHSHFTYRFRAMFGCALTDFRRSAKTGRSAELRKIMTARGVRPT